VFRYLIARSPVENDPNGSLQWAFASPLIRIVSFAPQNGSIRPRTAIRADYRRQNEGASITSYSAGAQAIALMRDPEPAGDRSKLTFHLRARRTLHMSTPKVSAVPMPAPTNGKNACE
jgi:hypothetical protein